MGRTGFLTGVWRPGWCRKRVRHRVPKWRATFFKIVTPRDWELLSWLPRAGWWLLSAGLKGQPDGRPYYECPRPEEDAMKRRLKTEGAQFIMPAAPSASVLLGKLPAIREFISATEYDDKTPREPGYLTIRTVGTQWQVTLYDPDSGSRLPVRAAELDKALLLAEQMIGVEEAPWEPDRYLTELLAKRSRKKK